MILTQGLNRQIRRMCSALGYRVQRLQRVRIINISNSAPLAHRASGADLDRAIGAEQRAARGARTRSRAPPGRRSAISAVQLERSTAAGTPSDHWRPIVARHSGSWARAASQRKEIVALDWSNRRG